MEADQLTVNGLAFATSSFCLFLLLNPLNTNPITNPNIVPNPSTNYANTIESVALNATMHVKSKIKYIPIKSITFINGEPLIKWTEAKAALMDEIENLQYTVIRKFS
ncbi:hypothetical protein HAX54_030593 [Datura stramonium]|uniref:Uncharacterized protein n=1 Tax=Datura stramonium TaxID=4076 RepID=A0ABS8V7W6_DATST|nr:hypothetical protein [Datura stramonium]